MLRRWGCQKGRSHGFFECGWPAIRYHKRRRLAGPATFCRIWKATFRYYQPNTSTTTRCKADWTMLPMKMADCSSIGTQMYSLFYYNSCDSDWLKNAPRSQPYSSVTHGWLHNVFHGLVAQDRQPHLRRATLGQTKRVSSKSVASLVSIA